MFSTDTAAQIRRFATDERGATVIEYGIIAVLVSVAIVALVAGTGSMVKTNLYEKVATALGTM